MLPGANAVETSRITADVFSGLDRRARPLAGTFADMKNLWGGAYPLLETRPARSLAGTLSRPQGLLGRDCLCWVDGSVLYVNGAGTDLGLTDGEKQLVSMGAYITVFPDGKYLNTADFSDHGAIEARATAASGAVLTLCAPDGTPYSLVTSETEPEDAAVGLLWLEPTEPALRRRSESGWAEETDACIRIEAAGIGAPFLAGDGIEIFGAEAASLRGSFVLEDAGEDFVLLRGLLPAGEVRQSTPLTVMRPLPQMDFVTECGNRLWGCRYGMEGGKAVNEIYASKLGDFKNWSCFAGLSTDAWVASRGADGPFTGAVTWQDTPIFFRENCIERVYPAADGAHSIVSVPAEGIMRGCAATAVPVRGALYYLSRGGVMAYDGALPVCVSDRLGTLRCERACAGALGGDYYLCLQSGGSAQLLQLDTVRGNWYAQDDLSVLAFAACGWELYALCEDGALLALTGGGEEDPIEWAFETGDLGLDVPEAKYISRLRLRCSLGGTMKTFLRYDSETEWRCAGTVHSHGLRSFTLPIRPRRCDHLRIRIEGSGAFRLYSLSRILEKGSDAL